MKKIIINQETLNDYLLGEFHSLEKDLHSTEEYTEEICPYCMGSGLVKIDNSYGLSEEKPQHGVRFPYKHQAIGFCWHCYNGVIKRCNRCGELMPRGMMKHNCKQQKEIDAEAAKIKEAAELAEIPEATEEQIASCKMFYSDHHHYNGGYFDSLQEFMDMWNDDHEEDDERPLYCFGTDKIPFRLSAESIIDNACEDYYDDAFEHVKNIDLLQELLDKWCEENGPGSAYACHKRFKIHIPWPEDEQEYYVTFKVDGRYTARVRARTVEEARERATEKWYDAEIGEISIVDSEDVIVEDSKGNFLWER